MFGAYQSAAENRSDRDMTETLNVVYLEPVPADVEAVVRACLPPGLALRVRGAAETRPTHWPKPTLCWWRLRR